MTDSQDDATFRKIATKSLDAELFAVGKWNGYEFNVRDLEQIVSSFDALGSRHRVPLKFGHNDSQPMTDGQPALGWVDKLWLDRSQSPVKLMGHFTDVPAPVYEAMKNKLYRKVSIELDFDVEHMGAKYASVLSGVALLGADIPAVNVLADLDAYMSRQGVADFSVVGKSKRVFTYERRGVTNMDELQKLQQEVARLTTENSQLKGENDLLKTDKANFTRREKEREESEKRAKLAAKRTEIDNWCEDSIKKGHMIPAQREMFKRAANYALDDKLLDTDVEPLKEMFSVKVTPPGAGDHGNGGGTGGGGTGESATAKVLRLTRAYQAQHKVDHQTAMEQVLRSDPALEKEYGAELRKEGA